MAFASSSSASMVDMNVTPLVDVMLVLLIIFMVTVPAISHSIPFELPQVGPEQPKGTPPPPIRIHIDASGMVSWNGSPTPMSSLQAQLDVEGARGLGSGTVVDARMQPTIEIETDADAEYATLAQVLARAKNANLAKVAFVQPDSN